MSQNAFLQQVVEYYYDDPQLSERSFIFPSKRAKAFFLYYLKEKCQAEGRYIFAPHCTTVNEFILGLYPKLQVADKTELLFDLYDYRQAQMGASGRQEEMERLDDFLFWGNIILSDFDLIDRNLIDAKEIYRNIEGLKELEDTNLDFLHEDTKAAIEQYFRGFVNTNKLEEGERQSLRNRFLTFWSSLYELYNMFREGISLRGRAYEGYVYRQVAEDSDVLEGFEQRFSPMLDNEIIPLVFVGLFDLSQSERRFFKKLRNRQLAEFVWDEEVLVVQDKEHPAYHLMKRNLRDFGSVSISDIQYGQWQAYKPQGKLQLYNCASTVTQVKALSTILHNSGVLDNHREGELDTLIVLTDEQMLLPLVGSLPEAYRHLNISLGYPLNRTSVSILINRWMRLLPTAYKGSYAVPSIIKLLSLQVLTAHYPSLLRLCHVLRKQKNYMLSGEWILRSYLPQVRRHIATKEGEEAAQNLDAAVPLLEILLLPKADALSFLRQLDTLLGILAEPMIAEQEAGQALDEDSPFILQEETKDGESALGTCKANHPQVQLGFDLVFLMHYQRLTRRLISLLEARQYGDFSREGAVHLLEGLSRNLTIPFKGDPLQGLQVMGLLESRSLHFKNVVYLMAQEGKLPKKKQSATFIPNILRYAYKLPTQEYDDAVEAYRFYQSISGCERLVMITGEEDSLGGKGEKSRYISQLDMLYGVEVETCSVQLKPEAQKYKAIRIDKRTPEVMDKLRSWLSPHEGEAEHKQSYLSPSSLNTYLQCPLKFYYQHIKGLRDEPELSEMLASSDYGTILHSAMSDYIYTFPPGTLIEAQTLEDILARGKGYFLEQAECAYVYFYQKANKERNISQNKARELNDLDRFYIQILASSLESIIRYDLNHCPFVYLYAERKFYCELDVLFEGEERSVCFHGYIDRIDKPCGEEGEYLRILDYKTGGDKNEAFDSIATLFAKPSEHKAALQTLLYCELLSQGKSNDEDSKFLDISNLKDLPLRPGLLITRQLAGNEEDYIPYLKLGKPTQYEILDYQSCREMYIGMVKSHLQDLFDLDKPFEQSLDNKPCAYCNFAELCHRKKASW